MLPVSSPTSLPEKNTLFASDVFPMQCIGVFFTVKTVGETTCNRAQNSCRHLPSVCAGGYRVGALGRRSRFYQTPVAPRSCRMWALDMRNRRRRRIPCF